jgi:L-lactate dehydrogenase
MNHIKIAIIGAGAVGSTIAYALILKNIMAHISLIDIDEIRCRGEILDLSDTLPFGSFSEITHGSLEDARNAHIIIIAAGKKQDPGQDRMALYEINKKTVASIIDSLNPIKKDTIIIVVTNPVDLMTYVAQQHAKLPQSQIFGSGTFLDTLRMRTLLAEHLSIAAPSIHAYVLGEHGDKQFPAWSCAYIGGTPLSSFGLSEKQLQTIAEKTRNKAREIIKCKGSTYYGIATCVAALCQTIFSNQKRITPLSCFIKEYKVCLSLPVVLSNKGTEKIIHPPLSQQENKLLMQSVELLQKFM